MISKGYQNFAYLGSDHAIDCAAKRRFDGFCRVLEKNGSAFKNVFSENQISNVSLGKKLIARLNEHLTDIDAVYCSNDSVAVGALLQRIQQQIDVPNDVAIARFSRHNMKQF